MNSMSVCALRVQRACCLGLCHERACCLGLRHERACCLGLRHERACCLGLRRERACCLGLRHEGPAAWVSVTKGPAAWVSVTKGLLPGSPSRRACCLGPCIGPVGSQRPQPPCSTGDACTAPQPLSLLWNPIASNSNSVAVTGRPALHVRRGVQPGVPLEPMLLDPPSNASQWHSTMTQPDMDSNLLKCTVTHIQCS